MKGFIYEWTNNRNGKKYVGSHIGELKDGYIGSGKYFKNAYNKEPYNFERKILQQIESKNIKEDIKNLENKFLKDFNVVEDSNYYNISGSYFGGDVYSGLNDDDKKTMILKWTNAQKIDRLNNPKKWEEIHKRQAKTRRSQEREIYQFTKEGNLIKRFECLAEVIDEIGGSKGNLHSTVNGNRNTFKGYRWSYTKKPNALIKREYSGKGIKRGPQKNPSSHKNITYQEVIQYDLQDNYIKTWTCAREIQEELGVSKGIISHCINGRYKDGIYKNYKFAKGNKIRIVEYNNKEED